MQIPPLLPTFAGMSNLSLSPHLWFHTDSGKLQHVVDYYTAIFGEDIQFGAIYPLGITPSGYSELCAFTLLGRSYQALSTAEIHHAFNDAISMQLYCETQEEIDRFWDYFTQDGNEFMCGWCSDKFGLRWQIVPKNMGYLMSQPNANSIMMKQKKIVISDYFQ